MCIAQTENDPTELSSYIHHIYLHDIPSIPLPLSSLYARCPNYLANQAHIPCSFRLTCDHYALWHVRMYTSGAHFFPELDEKHVHFVFRVLHHRIPHERDIT